MEKWVNVVGYENNYECSSIGSIRNKKTNHILKPQRISGGYYVVDLCKNGTIKKMLVHRIIASSFILNIENKPQVNHINGIKGDNNLSNLEWCTRSENQKHAIQLGLRHTRGEKNSQSKLNEAQVIEIFNNKNKLGVIADFYKISISTVCDIKRGYSWTHLTGMNNIKKKGDCNE